ncbi:MAG: N-acetylneuraminate synthase family protein [Solirubrobacteraceae bacterium]
MSAISSRWQAAVAGGVFVVAEIASNHNHDLSLAYELIHVAAEAGADAVKFQLFRGDSLYPPNAGRVDTPMGMADLNELFANLALPAEWLSPLRDRAHKEGLAFLCAAFDEQTLDQIAALEPPAIKIASPELNHLPLLRRAADLRRPLICSTGLATIGDIHEAIATIRSRWPNPELVILQCVSAYPLAPEQANIGVVRTLRDTFGFPTGLSDHTMDDERTPAIAVALGAVLIEKHFTLDRALPGPDHPISLEPAEFARMVAAVRALETLDEAGRLAWVRRRFGDVSPIIGLGLKQITLAEQPLYPNDKRSIHAIADISAGATLTSENIRVLRSERNLVPGLHPRYWDIACGAVTTGPLQAGDGVQWSHLVRHADEAGR